LGGTGEISVSVTLDGAEAVLTVADRGPGMDAETRRRACEPFFTTKPVGQGSGLGLAVVYGLAQALGGRVDIDSAPGRGTAIAVRTPLAAASAAA
jgi:signal transduction histidine kinase